MTWIADTMVLGGLGAQGAGLYFAFGPAVCALVVGTEVALIGLIGVMRIAR